MSFSAEVKQELCRAPVPEAGCARAEACGVLLHAHSFTAGEARIVTGSGAFAERLPPLFRAAFGVDFDERPAQGEKRAFRLASPDRLLTVWRALGYEPSQHYALHVNYALLEEEDCRGAFLRGAFLAGGSVTDPRKSYHLELTTPHLQASRETEALLRDMGFEPKRLMRKGNAVLYFKQSAPVSALLTRVGAPEAARQVLAAKREKGMRNTVNRRVNCDAANVDKAVEASLTQVEALTRLAEAGVVRTLSAGLQEVVVARLLQPELSLSELAATFDPPLTKSCLNHRMRKLMRMAEERGGEERRVSSH